VSILASLMCGFVFGCGLVVSGMIQPAKVLGFLDLFGIPSGTWDPSLAVVMAAALAVAGLGYALLGTRPPLFERKSLWPTKKDIDRSLLSGALLFGVGWGLIGLCPGPAIVNLSTLSLPVIHLCDRDGNRYGRPRSLAGARRRSRSESSC